MTAQCAISPSCFGVWDRGDAVEDFREFPFVRGTCCNAPWNRVEAKPGVFDWTQLDRLVEKAFRENVSLYVAFEAGPETPDWVYEGTKPASLRSSQRQAKEVEGTSGRTILSTSPQNTRSTITTAI